MAPQHTCQKKWVTSVVVLDSKLWYEVHVCSSILVLIDVIIDKDFKAYDVEPCINLMLMAVETMLMPFRFGKTGFS